MIHTPASNASERAFVGAVVNGDARALESGLRADDFLDGFCRQVFAACVQLETQGRRADLVTLYDAAPEIDSAALIALTGEASAEAALVNQHAENIRTASQRREVASICASAAKMAQDGAISLDETIHMARAALDQIGAQAASSGAVSGTDALAELYLWLTEENPEPALSTGLSRLDACLCGGLRGGKLVVVGARPGVGKSALLSFVAKHAIQAGRRVLMVSLEMGEREVAGRLVSLVSGVSGARMEAHTCSDGDKLAVLDAFRLLPGESFAVSTSARTPAAIRREALRMRATGGLDLLCVDYIQLLQPDVKTNGRTEAVGEISRALKLLAMELGIPILAAAQVNRASTQGEERAPRLSELRESGSIEQDADVVILLHDPKETERRGAKPLQLFVAKNRQGRCGKLDLMFDGALMRFTQVEDRFREG